MYGLPDDIDLGFFLGADVLQVCIGHHQVILNFEGGIHLTVEATLQIQRPDARAVSFEEPMAAATDLVQLIGATVQGVAGTPDGTLTLDFSNDWRLRVEDPSEEFESYQICHGERLIVV